MKFFNQTKGYGFIVEHETGKEFFVHASGMTFKDALQGDEVTFVESEGKKGMCATEVNRA